MSEKEATVEGTSPEGSAVSADRVESSPDQKGGDQALDFLKQHGSEEHFADDVGRMRRLRQRIDIRVIPFLALSYLVNFLDKSLLNYSAVMTPSIVEDLGLVGNNFTNAATSLWIAVVVAELPNIYFLQRMPVAKWLSFCVFGWGLATACQAATQNYAGLLTARIFCGIFEAGIPPSLMLISGQWYTRTEQVSRFLWWYMGTAGGLICGGFVSWCFQHVSPNAPFHGWRIMFLVLGLFTVCLGVAIFFLVPDTPMQAKFLNDQEKVSLLEHVKINQTGIENRRGFSFAQLKEALLDFQLYAQWLIMLLEGGGGGVITTYSATLIVGFGYSPKQAALLNMGTGAVAVTICLITSYGVKYFGNRWLFIIVLTIPALLGGGLMAYMPSTSKSALLAGIYFAPSIFADIPIQFGWVSANVAGHTKRALATAMLNAAFAIGNIIGPQTFQAKDAPDYKPAKAAFMSFQCVVVALAVSLMVYYRWQNNKRDKENTAAGADVADSMAFAGLTDKQNRQFRYVY